MEAALEMTMITRRLQRIARFEEIGSGIGLPVLDPSAAAAERPRG